MGRSSTKVPKRQRQRSHSRVSNYDEEEYEERGYRRPPTKQKSSRVSAYDSDSDDEDVERGHCRPHPKQRYSRAKSYYDHEYDEEDESNHLTYFLIFAFISFLAYLIWFPETNFTGFNLLKNENTRSIFEKTNEWKNFVIEQYEKMMGGREKVNIEVHEEDPINESEIENNSDSVSSENKPEAVDTQ